MKKNNKGFSLVELIVVVLIMGIIAVALAPQVMKWVDKARKNSDKNTAKDLKSSINTAIADALGDGAVLTGLSGQTVPIDTSLTTTNTAGVKVIAPYIVEVLGDDYPTKSSGGAFTATFTENASAPGSWKVEIN